MKRRSHKSMFTMGQWAILGVLASLVLATALAGLVFIWQFAVPADRPQAVGVTAITSQAAPVIFPTNTFQTLLPTSTAALTPIRRPVLSNQCPIDPSTGQDYGDEVNDLAIRSNSLLEWVLSSVNGYTDGIVSLTELAQTTSTAISEQQNIYDETKSIIPPVGMAVTHRKLIDSEYLYLTGLQALYVYTQTLDKSYLDRASYFVTSGGESLSEYNSDLQLIMKQCGYYE